MALKDYTKAIDINPENPEAYYNRAVLWGKIGKQKEGFEDLKRAARLGHLEAQKYLRLNKIE
jgi:tetratricopeptide (TPR) repeat protein